MRPIAMVGVTGEAVSWRRGRDRSGSPSVSTWTCGWSLFSVIVPGSSTSLTVTWTSSVAGLGRRLLAGGQHLRGDDRDEVDVVAVSVLGS